MTAPARLIAHPIRMSRPPGTPRPPRGEPEAIFRRQVQKRLTAHGWRWVYFPDSRRIEGDRGVPDILACRGTRVLFIETKTERGQLSEGQIDWLSALWQSGRVECCVFRPTDWARIEETLR